MIELIAKEEGRTEGLLVLGVNGVTIEIAVQHSDAGLRISYERVFTE